MKRTGIILQGLGLIVAPLGLLHFMTAQRYFPDLSEANLMTWELGCLAAGAALFLLGKRIAGGA